ncbi:MAG: FAD-binding protein [Bacteroidota bacterium]|nr:FAD-binding protein [Bacteroidota bacterium]
MIMNDWPYSLEWEKEEVIDSDILVMGGGVAGCMAAIAAAKCGQSVVLAEKGATKRSGAGGSGCDHWESAATNPCSKITPGELVQAMLDDNDGFNNGISHYIECREGYDRLLEIEKMGGKIRDTGGEFTGAAFRDEKTKLLFAYDYVNRYTLRVWGSTFKPAMYRELKRLGVRVIDRVMITSLLSESGKQGNRITGAAGIHTRTGRFYIFSAKASIMCMSRPARIWLFSGSLPGLCEFRPPQCVGDGHAMGWRAGAEFTMMEKSVRAEFSASGRSFPPYAAGNNHNTWYGADIIDSEARKIPYADRDGNILTGIADRFRPAQGQKFFLKGGSVDNPKYEYRGPETLPFTEMMLKGYKPPFYADLSSLPETERKVIWGMMVGEEGKTKVPVFRNHSALGFDPEKHVIQCYGAGWTSAEFLPDERQLFGLPGGFLNDWNLSSNLEGLFVAGDSLYASNCYGHAAATGHYAGRHAADYASGLKKSKPARSQVRTEKERVYNPVRNRHSTGMGWKELNMGISKVMKNYCGEVKHDELLKIGLRHLDDFEHNIIPGTCANNPHDLVRLLEVFDILTVAQIIMNACLARKSSVKALCFTKLDDSGTDDSGSLIVLRQKEGKVETRKLSIDFFGDLKKNYEKFSKEYFRGKSKPE